MTENSHCMHRRLISKAAAPFCAFAFLASLLVTGCGQEPLCSQVTHGQAACIGQGAKLGTTTHMAIDWVDFIKFGGIMYLSNTNKSTSTPLVATDLGNQFATVKFKTEGNVSDPSYHPKDGDAAFLAPGTPIYAVTGYAPTFLLAAYRNNQVVRYEADQNPRAMSGADLLDIGGKVTRIGVNSETDATTELGAISEPAQVQSLVALVLAAPVKQSAPPSSSGTRYFIAFHLRDGFIVTRAYWPETGELARGIMLPTAFRTAIEQAIATHT